MKHTSKAGPAGFEGREVPGWRSSSMCYGVVTVMGKRPNPAENLSRHTESGETLFIVITKTLASV